MKNNNIASIAGPILLIVTIISMTSCDPSRKWASEEKVQIQSFIASLGDTLYDLKPSGLYYINLKEGTGLMPEVDDTVSLRYRGLFLNYKEFDNNLSQTQPLFFIVGSGYIIKGLDEGVRYMKKGGRAKLVTPSSLAYGGQGIYGFIAGYTPLLWEIELVDVKPAKKK